MLGNIRHFRKEGKVSDEGCGNQTRLIAIVTTNTSET